MAVAPQQQYMVLDDVGQFVNFFNNAYLNDRRTHFQTASRSEALESVIDRIYSLRPCMFFATDEKIIIYLQMAKDLHEKLQEEVSCVWYCHTPIQFPWCTTDCKKGVVLGDRVLTLQQIKEGRELWRSEI